VLFFQIICFTWYRNADHREREIKRFLFLPFFPNSLKMMTQSDGMTGFPSVGPPPASFYYTVHLLLNQHVLFLTAKMRWSLCTFLYLFFPFFSTEPAVVCWLHVNKSSMRVDFKPSLITCCLLCMNKYMYKTLNKGLKWGRKRLGRENT